MSSLGLGAPLGQEVLVQDARMEVTVWDREAEVRER